MLAFIFRALISLRSVLKRRGIGTNLSSHYTIVSKRPAEVAEVAVGDLQSVTAPLKRISKRIT
jgi:hypothetical protein